MPRKLTEEMLARIRAVETARRAIPTRAQLAQELGVSESLVNQTARKLHFAPAEITSKTQLDYIELGLANP